MEDMTQKLVEGETRKQRRCSLASSWERASWGWKKSMCGGLEAARPGVWEPRGLERERRLERWAGPAGHLRSAAVSSVEGLTCGATCFNYGLQSSFWFPCGKRPLKDALKAHTGSRNSPCFVNNCTLNPSQPLTWVSSQLPLGTSCGF